MIFIKDLYCFVSVKMVNSVSSNKTRNKYQCTEITACKMELMNSYYSRDLQLHKFKFFNAGFAFRIFFFGPLLLFTNPLSLRKMNKYLKSSKDSVDCFAKILNFFLRDTIDKIYLKQKDQKLIFYNLVFFLWFTANFWDIIARIEK